MIEILIADDDPLVRVGLRAVLDAEADLRVVGEAADGEEAVALAAVLSPDVVIMDIRMPNLDGLSATRLILQAAEAPRVLVLGADDKLSRTVALPATAETFYSDLAVDPKGNLFVLDSVARRVLVVRPGSAEAVPFGPSLEKEIDFATSLAQRGIDRSPFARQESTLHECRPIGATDGTDNAEAQRPVPIVRG